MCFPADAVPPPVPRGLLRTSEPPDAHEAVIEAQDGACFRAAYAVASQSRGLAVLILPDVRGLFDFYVNLARAFASAGHDAIAIDYFGRTAGTEPRPHNFEFMPHIKGTTPENVQTDMIAARNHLSSVTGATSFASVGFCFGGSQSCLATTNAQLHLDAAISLYGGLDPKHLEVFPRPAHEANRMTGPILGLYGGADPSIPAELRDEFGVALSTAGVEHEFVVYPNAPHSFFDRTHHDFTVECADAWDRMLAFLRRE